MKFRPITSIDLYKTQHVLFYGKETTEIYENFTPRSTKYLPKIDKTDDKIVLFGLQGFIKWWLMEVWEREFFQRPIEEVIGHYEKRMNGCLGENNYPIEHLKALHKLGFLPLSIKALMEGSVVKAGVPYFTFVNTHTDFAWLPGFLEDCISNSIWRASTSATISRRYRQIAEFYAKETTDDRSYVDFFFHDFQLRGSGGIIDAQISGAGHLINFFGSDNVPAMDYLEDYYNTEGKLIGVGVNANEHSTVCAGGKENEFDNYKKWITETFPSGILSLVSDTWSLYNVVTNYLPRLKDQILARDGKVVIRPDSSPKTPLEIICGDSEAPEGSPEHKGVVELLYEIFGGSTNSKGYKELNPKIGIIYGEAIGLKLLGDIYERLKQKGFAANTCVFGIGSGAFLYGITRDTLGWACKATACIVNGEFREIFKDPVTDSGDKKSAKGLLRVDLVNNEYVLTDQCSGLEETHGELKEVFRNGHLLIDQNLAEIRERVSKSL